MINNNPYNISEKKPLFQSKILSQTNSSRHSSTNLQNRNSTQVIYSSGIFMKNSAIMNPQYEHKFYEPAKDSLSPHSKFVKPTKIQFVNGSGNIRPSQNYYLPPNLTIESILERNLAELRQKMENVEKRLEAQQRKQLNRKQSQNIKPQLNIDEQMLKQMLQESFSRSNHLTDIISTMARKQLQVESKFILQKLHDFQQSQGFITQNCKSDDHLIERVEVLQESFQKYQSQKTIQDQMLTKIKSIEKTIREMGQDIHLINDKSQNLTQKMLAQFSVIHNELKNIKTDEQMKTDQRITDQINLICKKVASLQVVFSQSLSSKIQELRANLQKIRSPFKQAKPFYQLKYLSEPIVLKYLQKFQVINSLTKQISAEFLFNEITYFVDNQGFLLDNDRFYLTYGPTNEKVKLGSKHIEILRKEHILI